MTLTREELEQAREYIYRQLPKVLEQDPAFVTLVEGIVAEKFPRRDEFARMLDELTETRREQRDGFRRVDTRFDRVESDVAELREGQDELRTDVKDLQQGQDELRTDVKDLQQGQDELRVEVKDLRQGQEELRAGQDELRADVKGLQKGHDELRAGQDELRTDVKALYRLIDERTEMLRKEFNDAVARLGQRWGLMTEDVLRQVVGAVVQDTYGGTVREVFIDDEQYDVVITNGAHLLIEVTSRTTQKIIPRLQRKRERYAEATGVEPARVILATAQIHYTVVRKLQEMGVEVVQPDIVREDE